MQVFWQHRKYGRLTRKPALSFLTAHETREMIVTAMGAGALDYIVKGCEDEEILYHIRCALKGNPIMSNKIHETVMQEYARLQQSEKSLLFFHKYFLSGMP